MGQRNRGEDGSMAHTAISMSEEAPLVVMNMIPDIQGMTSPTVPSVSPYLASRSRTEQEPSFPVC